MARKLRLEFPGACYHVINRGNYRVAVFEHEKTQAAFEKCLFEACAKSGWRLHAFVLMSNHFHLAIETPEGNLVAGMQWLQATFANRFNRLRGERGHLFQGRYKALLVEEGGPMGQLCHYIHLNPVRAGVCAVEALGEYRFGSYWYLGRPKARPEFMVALTALEQAGSLADDEAGRVAYSRYLAWQAEFGPAGRNQAYISMSRGWALGSNGFREALVKDHALLASSRAWERDGAREMRTVAWTKALHVAMKGLGKTPADARADRKSAPWKAVIAAHLKETTQASNGWLAEQLAMGSAKAVSVYVGQFRRRWESESERLSEVIGTIAT